MSGFDLQDFLDQQLEHNILHQPVREHHFQDVDIAGFGFPHYAHLNEQDHAINPK